MQRPASSVLLAAAALGASAWTAPAAADTILEVDLLSVSQARNTVQISNTGDGTRFSLVDVLGRSSQTTARLTLVTRGFRPGQEWHFLVAPLTIEGEGRLDGTVRFNGETFSAGPVGATYTFNSYRVNYRWPLSESRHWTWHWGVTGEIRDAEVALQQGSTHSSNTNTGFVPLLHLAGEGRYGAGSCRSTPTGWPVRRAGPSISARAWATRWARASICSAACA